MKEIPLTKGYVAFVDDEDYQRVVTAGSWCASSKKCGVYAVRRIAGRITYMHSYILDTNAEIDHRDGNGLNNCRSNIRCATRSQNNANRRRRSDTTSGMKGVYIDRRRSQWIARIHVSGRCYWLGSYPTRQLAAASYDAAAVRFFGEFALTNAALAARGG